MANAWVLVGIVAIFGFLGAYIYFTQFCETCKQGGGATGSNCADITTQAQCNNCPNCVWTSNNETNGPYCVQLLGTVGCSD